jgi:hypothetical protein
VFAKPPSRSRLPTSACLPPLLPLQQEKRKRAAGQATKGSNYVEEEKRLARNFGVYSGFD